MTADQYRAALAKLGLSQEGAAPLLGIGKRTSQGYALGESPVPQTVVLLLRLLLADARADAERILRAENRQLKKRIRQLQIALLSVDELWSKDTFLIDSPVGQVWARVRRAIAGDAND